MGNKKSILYSPFIVFIIIINYANAQIGLIPKAFEYSDSTKVKNTVKLQNLEEWHNYNQTELSLKYYNKNDYFDRNRYHPSNVMPKDPLKMDNRSSSYYVPRMVKDELNLMMNRPKGNSFFPILGVAFIAAQLASKYIFLQDKLKISPENVLKTIDDFEIINALWHKSPQTASELYQIPDLHEKQARNELNVKITNLIENKLIKQKNLKDQELQLFPAITKFDYKQLLQQVSADTSLNQSEKTKIQAIISR
jgi:predicted transcriptional regulator